MSDDRKERAGIVGAAGRTAVALLRTTGRRAKLGSLHLPLSLHPRRPEPITLRAETRPNPQETTQPPAESPLPLLSVELRALRSKLAAAEHRNALLRHALQRERLAAVRAADTVRDPGALVDQLVADLSTVAQIDADDVRQSVTSVLGAYGFHVGARAVRPEPVLSETSSIHRLDRRRLEELTRQILAAQPEIGSPRYVQLTLDALSRQGSVSLSQLVQLAGMSSPVAKRRLRLTLEALDEAGVARRNGGRYELAIS